MKRDQPRLHSAGSASSRESHPGPTSSILGCGCEEDMGPASSRVSTRVASEKSEEPGQFREVGVGVKEAPGHCGHHFSVSVSSPCSVLWGHSVVASCLLVLAVHDLQDWGHPHVQWSHWGDLDDQYQGFMRTGCLGPRNS